MSHQKGVHKGNNFNKQIPQENFQGASFHYLQSDREDYQSSGNSPLITTTHLASQEISSPIPSKIIATLTQHDLEIKMDTSLIPEAPKNPYNTRWKMRARSNTSSRQENSSKEGAPKRKSVLLTES